MKKSSFFLVGLPILISAVIAVSYVSAQSNDILQFNNLKIQSVASSGGTTILKAALIGDSSCIKFKSSESATGVSGPCPVVEVSSYAIEINSGTKLMLRDRQSATASDFSVGDVVNVFGYYNQLFSQRDGNVVALVVRNTSKPELKRFIQLDNVEVVSVSGETLPANLVVVQRPIYPCYDFGLGGEGIKKPYPCPMGLKSFSDNSVSAGVKAPESLVPIISSARKYVIKVDGSTVLIGKERVSISFKDITPGDKLNIYGAIESNGEIIDADLIKDLYKPIGGSGGVNTVDGIITSVNAGDGSFVIRTRDGDLITVENPVQPDMFVTVKGILDELKKTVSRVESIAVRDKNEIGAIPIISLVNPGSGQVGTKVTISGSGFALTGNYINFANVPRAISDVASANGKTLSFVVPATPCAPNVFCAQVVLEPGNYPVSVTNKSGTSNVAMFQVTQLPTFSIINTSLPEVVQGQRYSVPINAQGGADSYVWSVNSGYLPPGLSLINPVCFSYPCRAAANLSGTPTTPGTYTFTISLKSGTETTSKEFMLKVIQALNTN